MTVSNVNVARIVSITEDVVKFDDGGCLGLLVASIYFTCRLVLYFPNPHDSIHVIVHFNDENLCFRRDFFVRYFSRCAVDTF